MNDVFMPLICVLFFLGALLFLLSFRKWLTHENMICGAAYREEAGKWVQTGEDLVSAWSVQGCGRVAACWEFVATSWGRGSGWRDWRDFRMHGEFEGRKRVFCPKCWMAGERIGEKVDQEMKEALGLIRTSSNACLSWLAAAADGSEATLQSSALQAVPTLASCPAELTRRSVEPLVSEALQAVPMHIASCPAETARRLVRLLFRPQLEVDHFLTMCKLNAEARIAAQKELQRFVREEEAERRNCQVDRGDENPLYEEWRFHDLRMKFLANVLEKLGDKVE